MDTPGVTHQEWFRDWFDETYLDLYRHRDETEARSFLEPIRERYEPLARLGVADLACGPGRHCRIMAGELGWPVVALDLSSGMLETAALSCRDTAESVAFVRGDLRALPFRDESFGIVLNLFTSFGYFEDDTQHSLALAEMARILHRPGILVLDLLNPAWTIRHLVQEDTRVIHPWRAIQKRRYVPATHHLDKVIELTHDSGETRVIRESVRLFTREEIRDLMRQTGLGIRDIWGGYDASNFETDTSERMIVLAERLGWM